MQPILLGGESFLPATSIKSARAWRKKVRETVTPLIDTLSEGMKFEIETANDFTQVLHAMLPALVSIPDVLWELVRAYSPLIEESAEVLEETATDDEVAVAFAEMVKRTFPLERYLSLTGLQAPTISTK